MNTGVHWIRDQLVLRKVIPQWLHVLLIRVLLSVNHHFWLHDHFGIVEVIDITPRLPMIIIPPINVKRCASEFRDFYLGSGAVEAGGEVDRDD